MRPEREIISACYKVLSQHSRALDLASRCLPGRTREAVALCYSWIRYCDDEVDLAPNPHTAEARLVQLKAWTASAYEQDAPLGGDVPVAFVALRIFACRHRVPMEYPLEYLEGMH